MAYQVDFFDFETRTRYPIDAIEAADGYTADDYVRDCKENADDDWNRMLSGGMVILTEIREA